MGTDVPAAFQRALDSVRRAKARPELAVTEIPAPGNLAPYSVALSADVTPSRHGADSELGTGRFSITETDPMVTVNICEDWPARPHF